MDSSGIWIAEASGIGADGIQRPDHARFRLRSNRCGLTGL